MNGPGPCARCGKDPAEGYASFSWLVDGEWVEEWYCHPDEGESCYMLADWEGYYDFTQAVFRVEP